MENLTGKKVRGFKFKGPNYISDMDKHIGEIGVIESFNETDEVFRVQYKDDYWFYALSEIENHLVEEFERGELVEVRDDGTEWQERIFLTEIKGAEYPFICVVKQHKERFKNNKPFITETWKHIRKLKTKITLEEISKAFGVDVDRIEIVE